MSFTPKVHFFQNYLEQGDLFRGDKSQTHVSIISLDLFLVGLSREDLDLLPFSSRNGPPTACDRQTSKLVDMGWGRGCEISERTQRGAVFA